MKSIGRRLAVMDKEGVPGRITVGELRHAVAAELGYDIAVDFYANTCSVVMCRPKFDRRGARGHDARHTQVTHLTLQLRDLFLQFLQLPRNILILVVAGIGRWLSREARRAIVEA